MKLCGKKVFNTNELAQGRANEINKINKVNRVGTFLRVYKCPDCGRFHLTSMSKKHYGNTKDADSRTKAREIKFIKTETTFWERVFNINQPKKKR